MEIIGHTDVAIDNFIVKEKYLSISCFCFTYNLLIFLIFLTTAMLYLASNTLTK